MITTIACENTVIQRGLRRAAQHVEPRGYGQWDVLLSRRSPWRAETSVRGGWLRIKTRLAPPMARQPASRWLEVCGDLPAGAKIGIDPQEHRPYLIVDMPVDGQPDIEAVAAASARGLRRAELSCLQVADPQSTARQRSPNVGRGEEHLQRWLEVAQQAGIQVEDCDGQIRIPLQQPDGTTARRTLRCAGAFSVLSSEMADWDVALAEPCGTARTCLLLRANYTVRFCRASAGKQGERIVPSWQTVWAGSPHVDALHHALGAMSVAQRCTELELAALGDAETALAFLHLQKLYVSSDSLFQRSP